MVKAMDEVGRRYECGDYFLPEMLISARAMKEALALLRPRLVATDVKPAGTWWPAPSRATCTTSARTSSA